MNVPTHARRLRAAVPGCLLACSALLLTACGSDKGTEVNAAAAQATTASPTGTGSPTGSPSPTDTATRLTDDQAERRALVPAATVTWDKAVDTAVGEVSGSKLVEIELTRYQNGGTASPSPSPASPSPSPSPSPGSPVWETEVAAEDGTAHIVYVDAASGKVLGSLQEPDQDADDKRQTTDRLARAEITPEGAVQTATERTDGTVTAVQLDNDDADKLIWAVDVVTQADWNKTTFDVDATNGEILREEVDRD